MDRDVYVMLWSDDDGTPQCAVYEDRDLAEADAALIGGRVECRWVFASQRERTGRFDSR